MPRIAQRDALNAISKARLVELGRNLNARPRVDAPKSAWVEALAHTTRPSYEDILRVLDRDELKKVCKRNGLDRTGRTKQVLIDRILGRDNQALHQDDVRPPAQAALPLSHATPTLPPPIAGDGLKARLRRFVLSVASYRGRKTAEMFVEKLLGCFGWDGLPPGVESPCELSIVEHGKRAKRRVAASWPQRRVLIDVVDRDTMLDTEWKALYHACLQIDPIPQYVLLTNLRDFHLYDTGRDREAPRLPIALDDLPKYSEALPFLGKHYAPGDLPKIHNIEKVSRFVADLVAKLYRSLKAQHEDRDGEVINFTLQCIITMFAEDVGLLPQEYFTSLLYDIGESGGAEEKIGELFTLMATKDAGPDRTIPYFNGGLFSNPAVLPLGKEQLRALTKAAEADWAGVDPHIFGSVFQGIMDAADRHASGAHYTAREDIMRVVGPTIVEPWRKRIQEARTLGDLRELQKEMAAFRVLDPACGSGNFLYVSFRELYKLETELYVRMYEFDSVRNNPKNRPKWVSGISANNFYGIDNNRFAVELAKTTLNIAKKIAYEERKETAAALVDQAELELDPSLPLDNLDENIVCEDALFVDWPEVEAIVGNPPYLGGTKIREELGEEYLHQIQDAFPEVHGRADLCTYWFRKAHDRLSDNGRGGLVATKTVREGHTRPAALDYIVDNGATITNAVSVRDWPGEAVVKVSMVNWIKARLPGPHTLVVGGRAHLLSEIPTHLQLHVDVSKARKLRVNKDGSTKGIDIGTKACQVDRTTALEIRRDPAACPYVRPVAHGKHLLSGRLVTEPDYIVDMSGCPTLAAAQKGGAAFDFVERVKRPAVLAKSASFEGWSDRYWQAWRPRHSFFKHTADRRRLLVCSKHAARPIFVFLARSFFPTDSLQLFGFDDDYSFGVLQSAFHWEWAVARGSKIKADTRYTMAVWSSFPWPQSPPASAVAAVASAGRDLRATRKSIMAESSLSLRALYQSAEVAGGHPLKDSQRQLDVAVADAFGKPEMQDRLEFLLELNLCVAEDEMEGRPVTPPGLPPGLDPEDTRWHSADCIEPPPLEDFD